MAPETTAPQTPIQPDSAEAHFGVEVSRHLPRNFVAHLVHGLLGQTGFRLIHAPTFIPAYIELLSGSAFAVGVARACQAFGMFLSPILGATLIEHRPRVLPTGLWVGALMRVQILGIVLSGFFLSDRLALAALCLFLGLFGFFLGMQGVIFNFLMSKLIPVKRRGFLLGLRNALAGCSAGAVGVVGGHMVDVQLFGDGYAATFGLAFVLTMLGLGVLLFMREPASPQVRVASGLGSRLRDLPGLLRADRGFAFYFVARALGTMGRMSMPFYVLHADASVAITGRGLGLLSFAFIVTQSVGNLFWGLAADRRGFRGVFLASLVVWMASGGLLLAASSLGMVVAAMVLLGAGLGGFTLAAQNLVLEFGSRQNLPMRIALANSGAELVGTIGPLLGGLLFVAVDPAAVFVTAALFQLAALLMITGYVDEPRRRARPTA